MFRSAFRSGTKYVRDTIKRRSQIPFINLGKYYYYSTQQGASFNFDYGALIKLSPFLAYIMFDNMYRKDAENCGIVGVVGHDDASPYLLEGLTILQNRGYDSAGMATISDSGDLDVTKYASRETTADSIDLLRRNASKHVGHHIGLAHTRWATHGGKTDENAHPHTDAKNQVAVIHNGTINNSFELRDELIKKGIVFRSETDTEVIAHLIGINLELGMSTKDAVKAALKRCVSA
jgi:glucosamine--fructose-6-phosphate aminotransferase (isomerizing)